MYNENENVLYSIKYLLLYIMNSLSFVIRFALLEIYNMTVKKLLK